MKQTNDGQLVTAAQAGDLESLKVLYERYYRSMVWLAYSILSDRQLAEDAAQETFAAVCKSLKRLKQPEKFARYLARTCRNHALQTQRQRKRQTVTHNLPDMPAENSPDRNGSVEKLMRRALDSLTQKHRELLILHYYDGQSYEKIAALLEMPAHRVKSRLFQARRKIAEYLDRNKFDWELS